MLTQVQRPGIGDNIALDMFLGTLLKLVLFRFSVNFGLSLHIHFKVLHDNNVLICLGSDGIEYYWLSAFFILGTELPILEWNKVISLDSHRIMHSCTSCEVFWY